MTIAELIYLLCAGTSLLAAGLLIRQHRVRGTPLLFWSSLAFVGLGLNNVLVYLDLAILPSTDLSLIRTLPAAAALLVLVYGLVEHTRP
jgi:hypothetical protein